MSDAKKLATAAMASLMTLCVATAEAAKSPPASGYVKCYGVAAANKNDCGASCAGTIGTPGACYAFIYAPKDICAKLANASLSKPAADCKAP